MKKLLFVFSLMFAMLSCNNSTDNKATTNDSISVDSISVDTVIVDSLIDTISIY